MQLQKLLEECKPLKDILFFLLKKPTFSRKKRQKDKNKKFSFISEKFVLRSKKIGVYGNTRTGNSLEMVLHVYTKKNPLFL